MKFDSPRSLQESTLNRGLELSESTRWKRYTSAIREGYRAKNKFSIPENIVSTTAILLENTYNYCARMDETTRVNFA